MKNFGKIFLKTFNKIGILWLFLLFFSFLGNEVYSGTAETEAQNLFNAIQQNWLKDKDTYESKLYKPLTTNTPLSSLDGNSTGSGTLVCPGRQEGLIIEILQNPTTRDLDRISISYDTDLDGNFSSLNVNGPISGVCANGFVVCDLGTWNNCQFYRWEFSSGTLSFIPAAPHEMGGCYCINTSCQANLNEAEILRILGTGVGGAISVGFPSLMLSSGTVEPHRIIFFAQSPRDCQLSPSSGSLLTYSSRTPEQYYENPTLMEADANWAMSNQANDPDSLYYLVSNNPANTGIQQQTCYIERVVYFDTSSCQFKEVFTNTCGSLENDPNCILNKETVYDANNNAYITVSNSGETGVEIPETCKQITSDYTYCAIQNVGGQQSTYNICGTNCVEISIGKVGDNYWEGTCKTYEIYNDLFVYYPDAIDSVYLGRVKWDDYIQIFINDNLIWCGPDTSECMQTGELVTGVCERNTSWDVTVNKDITSYFATYGLKRVKVLVNVTGGGEGYAYLKVMLKDRSTVCRPWWKIAREYFCENTNNLNIDYSRPDHISSTISRSSSGYEYEDLVDGRIISYQENLSIRDFQVNCIKSCKVMKLIDAAQATLEETTNDYRYTPSQYRYEYKTCINDICPLETGETIVEPCQCLDTSAEALLRLETVRQAGIDMICSGN